MSMFTTPILLIAFNRPHETKIVLDQIAKIKPVSLYIAFDGPRNDLDVENCKAVKSLFDNIDWQCEVKTLNQEKNLGCKLGVSSALKWFFDQEVEGIILEDDILPSTSFFLFCNEMLERYRNDKRVGMITGNNLIAEDFKSSEYFFSEIYSIWGWATWRRVWHTYQVGLDDWPDPRKNLYLQNKFNPRKLGNYFIDNFDNVKAGLIDTWDHQWSYNCIFNSGLCLTPKVNLVTNIGVKGAHSTELGMNHFRERGEYFSSAESKYNPVIINYLWQNKYVKAQIRIEGVIAHKIKIAMKKLGIFILCKNIYKNIFKSSKFY